MGIPLSQRSNYNKKYEKKRSEGLCSYGSCPKKSKLFMCPKHLKKTRDRRKKNRLTINNQF